MDTGNQILIFLGVPLKKILIVAVLMTGISSFAGSRLSAVCEQVTSEGDYFEAPFAKLVLSGRAV